MADEDERLTDALFKEVDEEVRKDRYLELWKRYGKFVTGGALAIIIATAGVVWWRDHQRSIRGKQGEAFAAAAALAAGDKTDEAIKAYAKLAAGAGSSGYATLARIQEAALLAKKGDVAGAIARYDAVAADTNADASLRDLARVLSVLVALDTGKPAELTAKIAPLASGDGPWHHSALELSGYLAERAGDRKRARDIFTRLADDTTAPQNLRGRARAMVEMLGGS